jgi:hypothetical protein
MPRLTTRKEKIRRLRALAQSATNKHEAAVALEKARVLEATIGTGKIIAHDLAPLLEARGLRVRVERYRAAEVLKPGGVDVLIRYRQRRSNSSHAGPVYEIDVAEWAWTGRDYSRDR